MDRQYKENNMQLACDKSDIERDGCGPRLMWADGGCGPRLIWADGGCGPRLMWAEVDVGQG